MNDHIVLVEDNPSDVELVRTAFAELGLGVEFTVFDDGDEAITGFRALATHSGLPRLVLLDLNLPRTSGHDVLIAIRADQRFDTMPVVVFSTSSHPSDRQRSLANGADDYLVKPPRFDQLMAAVGGLRDRWLVGAPS